MSAPVFRDVGDAHRLRDSAPGWFLQLRHERRHGRHRLRDFIAERDERALAVDELEDGDGGH